MENSSYYIAPVGDRTHDLPHIVASNMIKVSHALYHSAMAAVNLGLLTACVAILLIDLSMKTPCFENAICFTVNYGLSNKCDHNASF